MGGFVKVLKDEEELSFHCGRGGEDEVGTSLANRPLSSTVRNLGSTNYYSTSTTNTSLNRYLFDAHNSTT